MVDMTIGERLRQVREEHRDTQLDLARIAGVHKQAISKIESDSTKDPGARTLEPICRVYGINLRWLLDGDGPKYNISSQSETVRLDPDTVAQTAKAIRKHYERRGKVYDMEVEPQRFIEAYLLHAELATEDDPSVVFDMGMRLSDVLASSSEESGDGRAEGVPASGTVERSVGRRRRDKA